MNRIALILLMLIFSIIVYGKLANSPNEDRDNLVIALSSAPRTLDPRYATDATSFRIAQLLYPAPVKFDEAGEPQPWATNWQTFSPKHYRLRLKPAFEFISIDDLIATYQSVLDKKTSSPHRGSLQHIKNIKKIDSKTVDFILSRPDPLFPGTLVIGIIPRDALADKKLKHYRSNGSFLLNKWNGEGDVYLKRKSDGLNVRFRVSKDPTIQTLQMLNNEIDIIPSGLPPELADHLSQFPQFSTKQRLGTTYAYIGMNLEDEVLKNKSIRQAIAYAIDRRAIIDSLLKAQGRLATSLMPPQHWSSNKKLVPYKPNLRKTKALLAKHGYDATNPLELSFKTSKNAFRLRIAALLQHQLKVANIHLNIQSYDWGTFYGDVKAGRFQLYTLAWVGIKQPDIYRYVFHSSMFPPKGANRGRYQNKQVDKYIDLADEKIYLKSKANAYHIMQKIIHSDLPYVPLWYENQYAIVNQRVKNFELASDGNLLGLDQVTLK